MTDHTTAEVPGAPGSNGVDADNLQRVPRRWVRDAVRTLRGDGYAVSPRHALRLIKDWRELHAAEAREFVREEFRTWAVKRGDVIRLRTRARASNTSWRITS